MSQRVRHIELPPEGALEKIGIDCRSVLNWGYTIERGEVMRLYEKGKQLQWDASTDIDWSIGVDPERDRFGAPEVLEAILDMPERLDAQRRRLFNHHRNAWMLSQFLHGEQGAMLASAKLVHTVPALEGKLYAASQAADEARHVEVYRRYLTDKLELSYPVNPHLRTLIDQVIGDSRWDITFLGMQIIVEGLALAAFGFMRFTQVDEPLIRQITQYVMRDEARHVAFGVLSLQDLYTKEMSSAELSEREEFVIEATILMHERLLMDEIWPRIGLDPRLWCPWSRTTPLMAGFRQMLFSRIVPNLKRLGLLTPRVRRAFAELDILGFETLPDSTNGEEETMPPALTAFFEHLHAAGVRIPEPAPASVAV